MNHCYRLIRNAAGLCVPAPETARRRGKTAAAGVVVAAALAVSGAWAAPTGGQISAGSGSIAQSGALTTISQGSQKLAINWQSFDIGVNETVNFVQPNGSAIALNRVLGTDGTQILGRLNANGQVWVLNPNGVLFGKSAQVDVGGLVASTLNLSDDDFLAGKTAFSGSGGSVVNQGRISASYVALLGGQVSNEGVIAARLGTVALAAGDKVTLDFDGDNLVDVQVDEGALNALAENKQLIRADGGLVVMTAKAKDALLGAVVNNTGIVEARSLENHGGRILLLGDMQSGTVNVTGTLDASATAPLAGEGAAVNGGSIETSAANVRIADTAKVTTLGANGGAAGTWLIDPDGFTIAASGGDMTGAAVSNALAGGNFTIASTNGTGNGGSNDGNIDVNDAVTWSANTLTLNATNNININAVMTASDSAGLALNYGGTNGNSSATPTANTGVNTGLTTGGFTGRVDFTGTGNTLGINGTPYTIITSLGAQGSTTGTDLQGINGNLAGNYALGANIDASTTATWNSDGSGGYYGFAPIGDGSINFTGTFDGLGHVVSNLTINRSGTDYVGLFGYFGYVFGSVIRNVGLTGAGVSGGDYVGGLVGENGGTVSSSYATGAVTGSLDYVGGLVGLNRGMVQTSYATGAVTGSAFVGGLVGFNDGIVQTSYATGAVSGSGSNEVGGLVGFNNGTVQTSYATGAVSGSGSNEVGGLVGFNNGTVQTSYATGGVSGGFAGGLVGYNNGTVQTSYWNSDTTGTGIGFGATTGVTGLALATLAGGLPTGFDPTIWGNQNNQTTPYLLANPGPVYLAADTAHLYTPVVTLNQLQAVGNNLTGYYALFNDIDATATSGWNSGEGFAPIGDNSTNFTGTFDGLGHVVSNLTINRSSTSYVGLFGYVGGGTVRNVGLQGGSVTGGFSVGGLAGINFGTVQTSYATGAVVSGSGSYVGGLVGLNDGTVLSSYATGAVSGSDNVGGLAGENGGTISTSYATGAVSGYGYVGGLVGFNGGTISTSYWDLFSTNQSNGIGGGTTSGATAVTSGASPTAFSSTNYSDLGTWSTSNGISTTSNGVWVMIEGSTRPFLQSEYQTTITNSHQLQLMAMNLSASYTLAANIDATETGANDGTAANSAGMWSGAGFAPVGQLASQFTGKFDGLGHTISGLTINLSGGNSIDYGMFGYADNAVLQNVGLLNVDIYGGSNGSTGALAGVIDGTTAVSNSYVDGGSVRTATQNVGGLVGALVSTNSSVSHSYANVSVSAQLGGGAGNTNAGGLAGISSGTISYSYATGSVSAPSGNTGANRIGGLVGIQTAGSISYSYATGAVSGNRTLGGLVGSQAGGTVTSSYWDKTTTGQATSAGGAGAIGLTTAQWLTNGPFVQDPTHWNAANWSAGNPYPGLTTLPYITIAASATQTYGSTASFSVASILNQTGADVSGLVNISGLVWTTSTSATSSAGTTSLVSGSGATAAGYQILYAGSVTVGKANATVTANSDTETYTGQAQSVTGFTVNGLVNNETASVLTGLLDTGGSGTNAGSYTHSVSVGTYSGNYNLSFVDGALTINKADATVTANSNTVTYNGLAQSVSGFTVSGLVNNETASVLTGLLDTGGSGTNAGSYTHTVGVGTYSGNYSLHFVDGALTINKADATVTANSNTVTYNGLAQSVTGFTVNGLVNNETASVLTGLLETGGSGTNAGSYAHTVSLGTYSGNYNITAFNPGSLTIDKADATVTANSSTVTYNGLAQSVTGFTASGLVNNETAGVLTGVVEAGGSGKDAGTYAHTLSGTDGNYNLTFVDGALTVNKADATVTANSNTVTYNGLAQSVSGLTVNGLVNNETASVLTGLLETGGSGTNAGSYAHTVGVGTYNGNYTLSFVNGALTITPAPLAITANGDSRTYDGTAFSGGNGVTYSGFVNGETASVLSGTLAYGGTAQGAANVGSYTIAPGGLSSANYAIAYADGTLSILTPQPASEAYASAIAGTLAETKGSNVSLLILKEGTGALQIQGCGVKLPEGVACE